MKIRCSWLPISQMCILEGASGQQGHMDRDTKVTPDLWTSTQVLPPDTVSPRAGKETREGKMQAPATTGVLGPSPPIVTLEGNTAHGGDQSSFPRVQLRNSRADQNSRGRGPCPHGCPHLKMCCIWMGALGAMCCTQVPTTASRGTEGLALASSLGTGAC